jgi:hypothetical protein
MDGNAATKDACNPYHDANSFLYSRFSINIRERYYIGKVLGQFCSGYSTVSETMQQCFKEFIGKSALSQFVFEKNISIISYHGQIFDVISS